MLTEELVSSKIVLKHILNSKLDINDTSTFEQIEENKSFFMRYGAKGGNSILHKAIIGQQGHDLILKLVSLIPGLLVKKNSRGQNALELLVMYAEPRTLLAVLDFCPQVLNLADSHGRSIVHYAVIHNKANLMRTLLGHYPGCLNVKDNEGWAAIHYAVRLGHVDYIEFLYNIGANLNAWTYMGENPSHIAARYNQAESLRVLFGLKPITIGHINLAGQTPLMIAAAQGNNEVIQALLDLSKLEQPSSLRKFFSKLVTCVEKPFDINEDDRSQLSALYYAISHNQLETLKLLLKQREINANFRDPKFNTPLLYAARLGDRSEAFKILWNCSKVNRVCMNEHDYNVVHYLCKSGDLENLKMVFEDVRIPVNIRTIEEDTPLHFAAKGGHTEVVKFLFSKGANIYHNYNNMTPIDVATQKNNVEMIELLERYRYGRFERERHRELRAQQDSDPFVEGNSMPQVESNTRLMAG